jgi:unsaturated chondroitin disaccharide hydrolase
VGTTHIRADGSTYHRIQFNTSTGAIVQYGPSQGLSAESTWSRGQAWAILGWAQAYEATSNATFLSHARTVAGWWISNVPSPDPVPPWDFDDPALASPPALAERDSSAAAITARGLLTLGQVDPDAARRATYLAHAEALLASLVTSYLGTAGSTEATLMRGSYRLDEYDQGLIFGDFYLLDALLTYRDVVPAAGQRLRDLSALGFRAGRTPRHGLRYTPA